MGTKAGQVQETAAQRALADHAVNLLQDYKQRWLPLQQQLGQQIEQEGAPNSAARRLAAGKTSTDTAIAFDKAGKGLEASLSNSGVGPGSSRANLAVTGMGTDQAASTGAGKMMSDQMVDDAYTQGLGALSSLGRGERGLVGQSMTAQAQQSGAQAAADAQASLTGRQGDAALAGQVAGFGLQQGLSQLPSMRGVSGTNDIAGVNGNNAMAKWNQFGVGGD
jgi:hypothetical protein